MFVGSIYQLINYYVCINLGIGDWGLGIGDWAQSPIPNPQSPIPIILKIKLFLIYFNKLLLIMI